MADGRPVPSELISGPDLGGGYLHQLSIDRGADATTFTFHAQDGGQDAGGPPRGPLDRLGFVHPPSPCMFGGPRCWHRRFLLPFEETPRVRFAYQRTRFVLETMIAQASGEAPVEATAALAEVIARIDTRLRQEGIEWYIGGSAAIWLMGEDLRPHDFDLGSTRAGVDRLGTLLSDYLIEPVAPTDWPPGRLVRGGRAFVGTARAGARVEWSVPLDPRDPVPFEEFSGVAGVARLTRVRFQQSELLVTRPEYSLVRSAERGRGELERAALHALHRTGVDRELLDGLLGRSSLPADQRAALRHSALA